MPLIPQKGQLLPAKIVDLEHPDRDAVLKWIHFCRDVYTCQGGFGMLLQRLDTAGQYIDPYDPQVAKLEYEQIANRSYLVRYARESREKFIARVRQAYLPPYVRLRVIQPLTGFLTRNPPQRTGYPTWAEDWLDEASVDGQGFDEWLRVEGIPWGLVYPGGLPVVLDADPHTAKTEAEREAQGAGFVRLRVVHPDRLLDWGKDLKGEFEWIKYETELDLSDPLLGHKTIKRVRWVTKDGWWFVDVDPEKKLNEVPVVASGVWPETLERAPIACLRFLSGDGVVQDCAPAAHKLFNVGSEKREGQRGGCFAVMAYPSKKSVDALTLGWANALPYDPETRAMPAFISPDMAPLDHLAQEEASTIQQIQEIGGTASIFGAGAEAAATLAYRFQATSRFIHSLAGSLVEFEYDILEIVSQWFGKPLEEIECAYNLQFDAIDVARFLEETEVAIGLGLPPTAKKVAKRRVIGVMDLWGDPEDQEKIEEELEVQADEEESVDQLPPAQPQEPQFPTQEDEND